MISFEKAKEKAERWLDDGVSSCREYADAYVFFEKGKVERTGGGVIVIMKSDGAALGMPEYALTTKATGAGKRIPLRPRKKKDGTATGNGSV